MKNKVSVQTSNHFMPIARINAELSGRDLVHVHVQVVEPYTHQWKELRDPHG
jgi:hypothetical protein